MSDALPLTYRSRLEDYQHHADRLLEALHAGDDAARWRFKWEHPRYRHAPVEEVQAADVDLAAAQIVVARQNGFENWEDLSAFADAVRLGGDVERFEAAVEAIVSGDTATLGAMLQAHPGLARSRSARRHRATLLHYLAANGVEAVRQKTPANAVVVAKMLLDAGAEADALADMYDARCTTMSMLLSSSHPAEAGLQVALAEMLLDYGAALDGPGTNWQSALMTALTFGCLDTARALVRRGARVDSVGAAAGLGLVEETMRLLPEADAHSRHAALALAAQLGHAQVVELLVDAGEDPDRYNPDGHHAHSTPLHQAVWANHGTVVRLLVERGARLDIRDTVFQGTPLGWALHGGRTEIADYLQGCGAPS